MRNSVHEEPPVAGSCVAIGGCVVGAAVVGPPEAEAEVGTEAAGMVVAVVVGDLVLVDVGGAAVVVVVVVASVVVVVVPGQVCDSTTLSTPVTRNCPPCKSPIDLPSGTVTYRCWLVGYDIDVRSEFV